MFWFEDGWVEVEDKKIHACFVYRASGYLFLASAADVVCGAEKENPTVEKRQRRQGRNKIRTKVHLVFFCGI